ncbi:recombinase family protein [Flavobacterium sp. LS2R12]|uniref:recombinase family protein n=1 Tax=unclassified Flavobacterium TaxID=196869 RepID=UPI003AAB3C83
MKARYNRISTANQNLERQLAKQNPDEVLYNDVVSGSVTFSERLRGGDLLKDIEADKINFVVVSSIDRLGRNLHDIVNTLEFFNDKGVVLRVDNLGLESLVLGKPNPTFNLIVSVMANVAVMERETLLERQREGISIAKAKGIYTGRVKGSVESDDEVLAKYKEVVKFLKMGKSLRDIVGRCGVSLGTVQKVKQIIKK